MDTFYSTKKETTGICHQLVLQTKFVERSMKLQVLEYLKCMSFAILNGHDYAYGSLHENRRTQLPTV